ncbi:MAG: GNAT family N-acetyltransferase [Betaproteobacteria bacterium]
MQIYPELLDLPDQLVGDRVMLRPYRPGDGAAFFAAVDRHRGELGTWLGWVDQHKTPDDGEAYVRRMRSKWIDRSALIFGIWSKDGCEYFGGTGFHGFNWAVPCFELGYFLHAGARGNGYAAEAVKLVTQFGFESLSAHRIWAKLRRAECAQRARPRTQRIHLRSASAQRRPQPSRRAARHADLRSYGASLMQTPVSAIKCDTLFKLCHNVESTIQLKVNCHETPRRARITRQL